MKKVYSAENVVMAGHVESLLQEAGINCFIKNQNLSGAMGELPPLECWPEVWINDDSLETKAKNIIDQTVRQAEPGPQWLCECGELIEGQFGSCWNCGRDKPTTSI